MIGARRDTVRHVVHELERFLPLLNLLDSLGFVGTIASTAPC